MLSQVESIVEPWASVWEWHWHHLHKIQTAVCVCWLALAAGLQPVRAYDFPAYDLDSDIWMGIRCRKTLGVKLPLISCSIKDGASCHKAMHSDDVMDDKTHQGALRWPSVTSACCSGTLRSLLLERAAECGRRHRYIPVWSADVILCNDMPVCNFVCVSVILKRGFCVEKQ